MLVDVAAGGTSLIVDTAVAGGVVVHWGAAVTGGATGGSVLAATVDALRPTQMGGNAVAPIGLVAEHGSAYPGRPGLSGRRADGTAWAPRFTERSVRLTD